MRCGWEVLEGRLFLSATPMAEVTGRYVFYNNSGFDGFDAAVGAADDGALAIDKVALLPGERATFANYTTYSRGINGVMVDLSGLPDGAAAGIEADDFDFFVGNSPDPASWARAPVPSEMSLRELDAPVGTTRVTITWPDRAIRNEWLQVTVKANDHTDLSSDDVFFFGNLAGDTGDGASVAQVTGRDRAAALPSLFSASPVDGRYDFDRNGVVDGTDLLVLRRNLYRRLRLPDSLTGAGMGLAATYFDDPEFAGISVQRTDPTVDFNWQTSPSPEIEPYLYSARWAGQVRPAYSETYTFHTTSNDGVRLWVDGQLLVDNWTDHAATTDTGQLELEAGRKYDIRLEYYQHFGAAQIRLEWSSPSQLREVVPASHLYPAPPDPVAPYVDDAANPAPPPVAGDWRMIFRDEFSGSALDPVWRTAQYWSRDHTVVGKGELEAYDSSGASVSDGMLHLTAREDPTYGVPYVSGLVQAGGERDAPTAPKFNFLYGYMEVRAKLPAGQGLWPAIWMMPASYDDANGELDVVEAIGSEPTTANFVVHRNGLDGGHEWQGPNLARTFHTFGVDWQPDHVTWYVDGVKRARTTDPALICPEAMYPILNVAVGGDWPGAPDATTTFPASMDVDFVRVWQNSPAVAP